MLCLFGNAEAPGDHIQRGLSADNTTNCARQIRMTALEHDISKNDRRWTVESFRRRLTGQFSGKDGYVTRLSPDGILPGSERREIL